LLVAHDALWHRIAPRALNLARIRSAKLVLVRILLPQMKKKEKKFRCLGCGRWVSLKAVGTRQRNHCPFCLRSKHVDLEKAGDRKSKCGKEMEPIGLTFKRAGKDKYGKPRQGELMVVHQCVGCGKISLNRISGDDNSRAVLKALQASQKLKPKRIRDLKKKGIEILSQKKRNDVAIQLFGKN
jgi:DNA-directed RNA polymerase subunit RPC12/RpoP